MDNHTQDSLHPEDLNQGKYFFAANDGIGHFGGTQHIQSQKGRNKNLNQITSNLQIGQRIRNELKTQGRSVSWLAQQLGMKRTSLYYIFHQNSLDLELLMRISFILDHNFMRDVVDLYDAKL